MPLKTSSFRKELFKQNFRNVGWISIIYLLGLFFTVPLQLMMALNSEYGVEPSDAGLFSTTFTFEIQAFFLFIMPVLMAIFLFRYLHVKEASDFIHSLPVRREKLFNYHLGSGLFLLILPILIISLILLMFLWFVDVSDFFSFSELGYWTLLMVIVSVLTFMSGVFVGTWTGLSAVQGILTYILLLFPAGFVLLVSYHIHFYVNGISAGLVMDSSLQRFSPIVNVLEYYPLRNEAGYLPVGYLDLGIYVVLSLVFYVLARIIYQKRQLEAASSAIALTSLKPVFKYGMTFCFALVGGLYFSDLQNAYSWIIAGYIFGGVLGYLLSVMLIEKTWRVFSWKQGKGFVVYGFAAALLITVLPLFWLNYESYVPEESEIKAVFFGNGYHHYEDTLSQNDPSLIRSEEGIAAVRQLHKEFINKDQPLDRGDRFYFIAYQLEGGEEVYRYYEVDKSLFNEEFAQVSNVKEYKELNYSVLKTEANEVQKVTLEPIYSGAPKPVNLLDPEKIESFLESYQKDLYDLSYEEMAYPRGLRTDGNLVIEGEDSEYISIYPSYDNTIKWLKNEGIYERVIIQPEDIARVEILPWGSPENVPDRVAYEQMKSQGNEAWTVTEEEKLSQVMKGSHDRGNGEYLVGVYYENDSHFYDVLSFTEEDAPEFIKNHFK
ncbi:DUF6449 domain-containing protein [Halobacillus mangrovi]|uniref:DUF6449 domain-containing protein n=1 Tax=Halobacillus mangrovi TaxID=402384 RepID=A0A1W6A0F1_9BACI|nr:DUF6449 domain-containing protein [Halobacillus mangrovi]ARI79013.1 hypothetical protein HM131_20240 [Halobacillus mangrovi]